MATASTETPAQQPVTAVNSSLYVGDLDREVTENQLFELFNQIGPVASVRVCRDAVTRRSLGYAYVNYNTALDPQAAQRALDELNYSPLNEKPIRIMWSHRDPAFRKSGVGNIFIKNLDKSIKNKELHGLFANFGRILSCKVATDAAGQSKGYGFVHFETEEAATAAKAKLNGMQVEGKTIHVSDFLKRSARPQTKERFTNVYLKNLGSMTEADLSKLVGEFGETTSVAVMKNDRGHFGFVNFKDAESAAKCVDALNGKKLADSDKPEQALYAARALKRAERDDLLKKEYEEKCNRMAAKNLYVKNLPDDMTEEQLKKEFSPFGTILSARVMVDDQKRSKGFGFVCYDSHEDASRAVTEMNGRMLQRKPLYVALAQRKEVRAAQLAQQMNQRNMQYARGGMQGMYAPGAPMYYPGPRGGMPYGMMNPAPFMAGAGRGMAGGRGRGMPGMNMSQPGYGMFAPGPMPMMGGRGRTGGRGRGAQGAQVAQPQEGGRGAGRAGRGQGRGQGGRGRGRGAPASQNQQPPPPPPVAAEKAPAAEPVAEKAAAEKAPADASQSLSVAMLVNLPPEQQKQMIGERLFPLVQAVQPVLAGKITGMFLEMDNSELLGLLEDKEALENKVQEAIQVLKQHNALPEGVSA
jgi:polyadenylate-binding protein